MANTIFFGNGINRMIGGESWDDVLKRLSLHGPLPSINSNTLKYEYIILTKEDKIKVPWLLNGRPLMAGGKFLACYVSMENHIIKRGLCRELKKQPISPYYTELAKLNATYYVTTNYETFLNDEFERQSYIRKNPVKDKSRLFARDVIEKNNQIISLWNIHGNWSAPETIMLGIRDYCDYIAEINKLISENEVGNELSWTDLFLKTDVHIVGFGLAYEETDVWYVLTHRKRMMRHAVNEINNHVFFYVVDKYADESKNELLKAMDVEVVIIPSQSTDEETNRRLFEVLRKKIGTRKT